jgi:hypothetical protein
MSVCPTRNHGAPYSALRAPGYLQHAQPPPTLHTYGFSRSPRSLHIGQPRTVQRYRCNPELPTELWEKIIAVIPRRDQIAFLTVSKTFYSLALRALLSVIKLHLNDWEEDVIMLCNGLLTRISCQPSWAKCVRVLMLYIKDQVDYRCGFSLPRFIKRNRMSDVFSDLMQLENALQYLPYLKTFRLVVTWWDNCELYEDQASVKRLIQVVFHYCRHLEEVVLPHP